MALVNGDLPVDSASELTAGSRNRGLTIGAMGNDPFASIERELQIAGIDFDSIHSGVSLGKKPGGLLVTHFCATHGFEPHETLVLGKDKFGILKALNGRAIGFHAVGAGESDYGIKVDEVAEFFEYLDSFFTKDHLWYAKYDGLDGLGRAVHLRALIDGSGAGDQITKDRLYKTLKNKKDVQIAGTSLSKILMMDLLASAYLEGILNINRGLFEGYPGLSPQSECRPIIEAIIKGFTLFRASRGPELTRHSIALQSHKQRIINKQGSVTFTNQLNTIILTDCGKVLGRRAFVFDDFTTKGYSIEAARSLLMAVGVTEVYGLAVGKYGPTFEVQTPQSKAARTLHPEVVNQFVDHDFGERYARMAIDPSALTEFLESVERIKRSAIGPKLHPR